MSQYSFDQQQLIDAPTHYLRNSDEAGAAHTYRESLEHGAGSPHYAFDQNQRAIPGLALGSSQGEGSVPWVYDTHRATAAQVSHGQGNAFEKHQQQSYRTVGADVPMDDVAMEDQLSDGELEDIYEPTVDDIPAMHSVMVQGQPDDRFGSYSPRLSPPAGAQDRIGAPKYENAVSVASDDHHQLQEHQGFDRLRRAREDARQAILSLWPLQVRVENYLENGVDGSLLKTLFEEAGLAFEPPAAGELPNLEAEPSPKPPPASGMAPATGDAGDENTESRKDRIARLLAAKRTQQPTPPAASQAVPVPTSDGTREQEPKKKSVDKSKLLYAKMEALRKAREAKAQSVAEVQQLVDDVGAAPPAAEHLDTADPHAPHGLRDEDTAPDSVTDLQGAALSEISSHQALSRTPVQKRPVASDFLSSQQEPMLKRPFSRTNQSRRFLIDVSDDDDSDDDTAMDIDSPEQRPLTLRRNFTEDSALRNYPPLSELPSNGRSTPTTGYGRSNTSHQNENLSKMQQDIEEMKKRIAEAEARKKAKQSRQGTPQQSPAPGRSDASLGSPSNVSALNGTPAAMPATAVLMNTSDVDSSAQTGSDADLRSHQGIPELRRSLSQATLSRLAVIEADRKRQTLKMKILRAQLAQMEREMAANLEEEKVLREQATASPSSEDVPVLSNVNQQAPQHEAHYATAESEELPHAGGVPGDGPGHSGEPTQTVLSPGLAAIALDEQGPTDHVESEESAGPHSEGDDASLGSLSESDGGGILTKEPVTATLAQTMTANVEKHSNALSREATNSDSPEDGEDDEDEENASEASSPSQSVDMEKSSSSSGEASSDASGASREVSRTRNRSSSVVADIPANEPTSRDDPSLVDVNMTNVEAEATLPSPSPETQLDAKPANFPTPRQNGTEETENEGQQPLSHAASASAGADGNSFQPYESPLQYFHAYRFHPEFTKSVKGGLRSLTYSNKLDVRQQLCPEELLGQECPRGNECDFQHLAKVAAPDDQILMQLGSYGSHEGDQQEDFNKGLRKLLTDFRDKKVKDFQTISQAIIEYRAQFHHDRSRILPLGNVSL